MKNFAERRAEELEKVRAFIEQRRAQRKGAPTATEPRPTPVPRITGKPDWSETGVCVQCGISHDAENRQRLIRPMAHMEAREIREAWPCFYEGREVMLYRDLRALGVRKSSGRKVFGRTA